MSDFDIREAVRAVIEETDLTAPEEIAAKVAEGVPARQLRPVLSWVLRDYVRVELGRDRRHHHDVPLFARSAKREAIVEYAQRWLRDRVSVANEWKMVGDCTAEDCLTVAAERRENARRNVLAAELWEARADLLKQHRSRRLADLPPDALGEAEGREAA